MHFLLLNQTFYPDEVATAQQLLDLARFLTKNGHRVSVIAEARGYENRKVRYPSFETFEGIEIHRVRSTGFGKKIIPLRLIDALTFDIFLFLKLFFFPKVDYVVSFTSPPLIGFLGVLYAKWKRTKSVQWLMDINPEIAVVVGYLKRNALVTKLLFGAFDFSIQQSEKIVVLDRWMKKKITPLLTPEQKAIVVHPWSVVKSQGKLNANFEDSLFRKENKLGDKFIVLFSGNHSIGHPLDTLFEAALRLKNDPSIVFAFVGSGVRAPEVGKFRDKHGLKNILQLPLQRREVLSDMLKSSNLHAIVMGENLSGLMHPSKIYSILATGRPYLFIGPKEGHVTDIIRQCPYGFFAEHGDVNQVISSIERVKSYRDSEYERVAQHNIPFVTEHFSIEKSLGAFLSGVTDSPTEKENLTLESFLASK